MDLLKTLRDDPRARELMKGLPAPQNEDDMLAGYLKTAKELGYDVTAEEVRESMKKTEQELRQKAEKIRLEDDTLENVAGGGFDGTHPGYCDDTYKDGEWCWFTDSCSLVISYYSSDLFVVVDQPETETLKEKDEFD